MNQPMKACNKLTTCKQQMINKHQKLMKKQPKQLKHQELIEDNSKQSSNDHHHRLPLESKSKSLLIKSMKSIIIDAGNDIDDNVESNSKKPSGSENQKKLTGGPSAKSADGTTSGQSSSLLTIKTSKSTETIVENYLRRKQLEPLAIIGEGGFSVVYKVRNLNNKSESSNIFAAKIIRLNEQNRLWITNCLKHEMFISKLLKHPNIVRTYDYFKTTTYACILMEYYSNGNIRQDMDGRYQIFMKNQSSQLQSIQSQSSTSSPIPFSPYDHQEILKLFTGLIEGLQFIHNHNIAHRDLKPDNFFLNDQRQPLIGDFGFATIGTRQSHIIIENLLRQTRCGSEGYMAPEIQCISPTTANTNNDYYYNAKKSDIYSMGICLYEMFHYQLPPLSILLSSSSSSLKKLFINSSTINIQKQWQQLIISMLWLDPNKRPTCNDILFTITSPLFQFKNN